LKKNGIEISMTQSGDSLENAVAERINKTIKEDFATERQMSFRSLKNAQESMDKIVEFYNTKRPHRSVEWLTPIQAHEITDELKRHWKTYYKKRKQQDSNININD
jgi:putative transposase